MRSLRLSFILTLLWVVYPYISLSQIIGGSGYLIGDYVEIGVNAAGHEGAPLLGGSNNRSNQAPGSPVYFGFVANPQLDGWGDYDGDFFTPGAPENGFGLEIDGVNYGNNASGLLEEIPGAISGYEVTGDCMALTWDGVVGDIEVHIVYRLVSTELYYTTEITLTNVGGTDYTDIYYYRNVDPDNNVTIGGGYGTQNTIVAQPEPDCEKALVTATQDTPWDSYIGFGAIGTDFRVSYGGFANRDASDIWNGAGGLTGTVGSSVFADQAISLAYRVMDLPAGESETFSFTVVLDETYIDAAISSLYYFEYAGDGGVIDECNPVVDTVAICPGDSVMISVDGPNADDYVWTWSPPEGLSTTDGPTTNASPIVSTEYTVSGAPAPLCLSSSIEKSIFVEIAPNPTIEIIGPDSICDSSFDLTTLTVNELAGIDNFKSDFYSIVPDSVNQTVGLWPTDFLYPDDTVYVMVGDSIAGCMQVEPWTVVFTEGSNAGPDNSGDLCSSPGSTIALNDLLTGADADGTWEELTGSGAFDPITAMFDGSGLTVGVYDFMYTVSEAACPEDTAFISITVLPDPIIDAGLDQTICPGDLAILSGDGAGPGGTYLWDGGGVDGLPVSPDITTTYTVTGYDANDCYNTDEMTVFVLPAPSVNAGPDLELCEGETAALSATGALDYSWTGGISNGVPFTPGIGFNEYTVTGTNADGCEATDDVSITVHALPEIAAPEDITVCDGTAITLSAVGAPTITWSGGVIDGEAFIPTETTTYTVTGTDENGCAGIDEVTVTLAEIPYVAFEADILSGCYPLTVNFSNISPGTSIDCQWEIDGETISGCDEITTTFDYADCFDITLNMMSEEGCVGSKTYWDYICIDEYPVASFYPSPSTVISTDPGSKMVNLSTGATSYSWDMGDGTTGVMEEEPFHVFPPNSNTYNVTLVAASNLGCTDTAYSTVKVLEELIFYIPNTFTPDGDTFNESFKPIFTSGLDIYDYHLTIFNRWGEIVFESFDVNYGWNGTYGNGPKVEDGVYIWQIEFGDINSDKKHTENGHVTVLQ